MNRKAVKHNPRTGCLDAPSLAIRDAGPYSTRNTAKGALITEVGQVVAALAGGMTIDQVRDAVLGGSQLPQRSINSRKGIWDRIHYRYLTHRIDWVIASLIEAHQHGDRSDEFVSLLYLHYALRDRLTYDFVTGMLWHKSGRNRIPVSRNEVLDLLDAKAPDHPEIERWTESSRVKLGGNMLSALRDFRVLEGIQKKFMARPKLPQSTAAHLLRILVAEGNRGRQILEHTTWRLFLLAEQDVAATLARLAADGQIQFEKVGSTVVLQTPPHWEDAS
jgi:hypothetical protein